MTRTNGAKLAKCAKRILGCIAVLMISGCSISVNPVSTESLQTAVIDVAMPADTTAVWNVELDPGAASVSTDVGDDRVISGTIDYNVQSWKPVITTSDQSVVIKQGEFTGIPPAGAQNDWNLRLGRGVPMNLTVNAGAVRGEWELGGLSLRGLNWHQGAADATVRFSEANPLQLEGFNLDAGASAMRIQGLANMNAGSARINIGAGTLTLRFDGKLVRDLDITLEGGAAAVTIDSGGNPVQVVVGKNLTTVSRGEWSAGGDGYQSPEWAGAAGPRISVRAQLGAASLNLVSAR